MASSKKLPPSRKKLRKAREDGSVAKSRELSGAVALSTGFAYVFLFWERFLVLRELLREYFGPEQDFHTNNMLVCLHEAFDVFASIVLPFLLLISVASICVEVLQVGLVVSLKPIGFTFSRLGFWSGIKRILGMSQVGDESLSLSGLLYEFGRIFFYTLIVVGVTLFVLLRHVDVLGFVSYSTSAEAYVVMMLLCRRLAVLVLGCFLILGAIDLIYRRSKHLDGLRMDVDEFRREMRESEGDPEAKHMRKQLHQELTLHDLLQGVRKSKVVVVGRSSP